uniref:7TM GPCR serpentine receptor class x (Srx) domain-containing protein n=1 Tax=Ascaris lumbricoides TaxID=6252 RepID=A0A0M3HLN4_ASCLU
MTSIASSHRLVEHAIAVILMFFVNQGNVLIAHLLFIYFSSEE